MQMSQEEVREYLKVRSLMLYEELFCVDNDLHVWMKIGDTFQDCICNHWDTQDLQAIVREKQGWWIRIPYMPFGLFGYQDNIFGFQYELLPPSDEHRALAQSFKGIYDWQDGKPAHPFTILVTTT